MAEQPARHARLEAGVAAAAHHVALELGAVQQPGRRAGLRAVANAWPGGSTALSSSWASGTERRCGAPGACRRRSRRPRPGRPRRGRARGRSRRARARTGGPRCPGSAPAVAAAVITNARIALVNEAMRTVPAGASRSALRSSSAAPMRSRIARAWAASATPASVSATARPWRSSSAVPLSRSSTASCCDTADGLIDAATATARTVPRLSSWISRRSRLGSSTVQQNRTA